MGLGSEEQSIYLMSRKVSVRASVGHLSAAPALFLAEGPGLVVAGNVLQVGLQLVAVPGGVQHSLERDSFHAVFGQPLLTGQPGVWPGQWHSRFKDL